METLAGAGTWEWDVASDRLRWSPQLVSIYGLGLGEPPTSYDGFLSRVHPEDLELTRATVERAVSDRRDVEYQHRIVRADGAVRVLRSFVHVDSNDEGEVVRLSGACQDVTEQVELAERVRRLQALASAGTIAAGLAHDLNNVVGAMSLLCGALVVEPDSENAALIEDILHAAMRAAEITARIQQVARRPARVAPRVEVVVELERIVNLMRQVFSETFSVELEVRDEVGGIRIDPLDLERVLWNLGLNARDAQPGGGVIEVIVERVTVIGHGAPGEYCRITVRDEGSGMDEATAARLFEPFFTTKGSRGTGLGLAVVHDVVDDAGGFVTVDSRRGRGTRIRIHLPPACD